MSFVTNSVKKRKNNPTNGTVATKNGGSFVSRSVVANRGKEKTDVFGRDLAALTKLYESDYNAYAERAKTNGYRADSREWFDSAAERNNQYKAKRNDVLNYLEANRDSMDSKQVAEIENYIKSTDDFYTNLLIGSLNERAVYSKFNDAEQFDKWLRSNEYAKKYDGITYGDTQKAIANVTKKGGEYAQEEVDWLTNNAKTKSVIDTMTTDDFEGRKAERQRLLEQRKKLDQDGQMTDEERLIRDEIDEKLKDYDAVAYYNDNGETAVTYDQLYAVKSIEDKIEKIKSNPVLNAAYEALVTFEDPLNDQNDLHKMGNAVAAITARQDPSVVPIDGYEEDLQYIIEKYGIDPNGTDEYIKNEIINAYNSVGANYNSAAEAQKQILADAGFDWEEIEYYHQLQADNAEREELKSNAESLADDAPVLAAVMGAFAQSTRGLSLINDVGDLVRGFGADDDSAYNIANIYDNNAGTFADTVQNRISENIGNAVMDKTDSEALSWLAKTAYGGMTSAVQSGATQAIFGRAGQVILGSQAAESAYVQSIKNGSTKEQAMATGVAAGVAEALFEHFSFEKLVNLELDMDTSSVSNFIKSFFKNSAKVAGQGGIEASEELFTSLSNTITDQLFNGDRSEYNTAVDRYVRSGMSLEDAKSKAAKDFVEGLVGDAVGGFFGGIAGAGVKGTAVNTLGAIESTARAISNKVDENRWHQYTGQKFIANDAVADLVKAAQGLDDSKGSRELKALADKVAGVTQENASKRDARNVGKLYQGIQEENNRRVGDPKKQALTEKVRSALKEKGVSDVDKATDIIVKSLTVKKPLTSSELRLFNKVGGKDIVNSITKNTNLKTESVEIASEAQYNKQALGLKGIGVSTKQDEIQTNDQDKNFSVKSGAEVSNPVFVDTKDGVKIKVSDDESVNAKDISWKNETIGAIYGAVADLGADAKIANEIVGLFDGSYSRAGKAMASDLYLAYNYGYYNYGTDSLKKLTSLTSQQAKFVYNEGRQQAALRRGQEQKKVESAKEKAKGNSKTARAGNVELAKNVPAESERNPIQKANILAAEIIAKLTGVDIYIGFSEKDAKGDLIWEWEGGKVKGANGLYYNGKIYLDLNAGNVGENTMLDTLGHELGHWIKQYNPKAFYEIGDYLMEQYSKMGGGASERIGKQQQIISRREKENLAEAKKNGTKYVTKTETEIYDEAYEEFVCESFTSMLRDGTVVQNLAELKKQNQTLWQVIMDAIKALLEKWNIISKEYEHKDFTTEEARFVSAMDGVFKRLQEMYTEALQGASENFEAIGYDMSNEEAFADSATAVHSQIRPPSSDGSKAFKEFAENLSEEARSTFDLFYGFYQKSRITNALSVSGKRVKGVNISSLYLRAQEWNEMLEKDEKWKTAAQELADFLPSSVREKMRMNKDGTLNPNPMEEEFKMPSSLAQRLVDSLPYEMIDETYTLGNKTITLPEGKARQSVGGEAYRRAIINETRKLFAEGKLRKVGIGTMSKDRWGSLGFLAANGKTGASGDFTTVCPQMMFNRGCWYCYRRAAMEKGVNNKLVANNVWYTGEILRIKDSDIKQLNENGGLRIQSFGDWMPHFSAMLADVLYDAELRGLQVKIITKEPSMINYIAALREQGIGKNLYFNLSADYTIEKASKGSGELDAVNPERPFQRIDEEFWWKRAMTVEEAAKYREKYPWVNTRIVASTIEEFIRGLKDSKVDVVTGYHGNIREFERVDSTTGKHVVEVEALGDAGMPRFAYNPSTSEWVTEYEGKTKTHKALAEAIAREGLQMEYYTKTCCITGRCATCKGKCGALARDFNVKNATNRDEESVAYWQKEMQYGIEPEFGDMTVDSDSSAIDLSKVKAQARELQRKDPTKLTEDDLLSLLEFSKAKMFQDGSFIPVRINTPQILIAFAKRFGHTLENHPLAMNVYKARQALSNEENWDGRSLDKPHDLTAEEVVEIVKAMNDPSYLVFQVENDRFAEIVKFERDGGKEKAYAIIDFFDVEKNPELMNGYNGGKYNILVTIYPSENNDELKSYLHNKNHKVITGEEMKKKGLSQRGLGSQVPAHLNDSPFFDNSLSHSAKKSQEVDLKKAKLQERSTNTSNRSILVNALESAANTDEEKAVLKQYKGNVRMLDNQQKRLQMIGNQLRRLTYKKGKRSEEDKKKLADLRQMYKETNEKIYEYDRKLVSLEAMNPIKRVIQRERTLVSKKEKALARERLSKLRREKNERFEAMKKHNTEMRQKNVEGRQRTILRHKIKKVVGELNHLIVHGTKERNVKIPLEPTVRAALIAADRIFASDSGENIVDCLNQLQDAYGGLKSSKDDLVRSVYKEDLADKILEVKTSIGDTPFSELDRKTLQKIYDVYKMVKHMVTSANKVFREGKAETVTELANSVMEEIRSMKMRDKSGIAIVKKLLDPVGKFLYQNNKPVYVFDQIGSKALTKLYWDAVSAEGVYAKDIEDAQKFVNNLKKKYGYEHWNLKKTYTFDLANGDKFHLNVPLMMSIYAYSFRDNAYEHMTKGGFMFDEYETYKEEGKVLARMQPSAKRFVVNDDIIEQIVGTLTDEQKAYAEEMQKYLSETMGAKGNSVSRELYGVDLFKEDFYFPLKSQTDFLNSVTEALQKTPNQSSLKNTGMTKEVVPHASNPIILQSFDDVWQSHVNKMSQYHALVLPIENLQKVFNYKVTLDGGIEQESVKNTLSDVFGVGATTYIDNYITDLNGGVQTGGYNSPTMSFFGKFKKSAVASSLSVVIQQPFAVIRAMSMVRPDYFIPFIRHKGKMDGETLYEELKKYAPVAIIKEMGGFDVSSSRQATDYLGVTEYHGKNKAKGFLTDKTYRDASLDNAFMFGASLADKLGWLHLWSAVKKEVGAKMKDKVGTEEYLKACGERFTEVVVYTQVYDSVNSKSGFMRSKSDLNKFATSFMGEPTTTYNMLANAFIQLVRAKKGNRAKAIGKFAATNASVFASIVMTSAFKSIIYAFWDDDDDESMLEKWAEEFAGSLGSDLLVFNMIPYVRDFVSLWQGWDVERPDMSILADIKAAYDKLNKDDVTTYDKIEEFGGAVASAFGLPVRNIMRDVRGIYNAVESVFDENKPDDMKNAFVRGWTGKDLTDSANIYKAVNENNETLISAIRSKYGTDKKYQTALRKALKENDPRIQEAAQARNSGDMSTYKRIAREIANEGNFTIDDVIWAINSSFNSLQPKEEDTSSSGSQDLFKISDYFLAVDNNQTEDAEIVKQNFIETAIGEGKSKKDAEKDFYSRVRTHIRNRWKDGEYTDAEARKALRYHGGLSTNEAVKKVRDWKKDTEEK